MPKEWTYDQVVTLCEIDGVPLPEEFVEWMAEKLTMAANRAWDDAAPSVADTAGASGQTCGNCNGTGWMVRDPDIGTDQECFVCEGSGKFEDDEHAAAWALRSHSGIIREITANKSDTSNWHPDFVVALYEHSAVGRRELMSIVRDLLTASDLLSRRWKSQNAAVGRRLFEHAETLATAARSQEHARHEGLITDAERYRWLVSNSHFESMLRHRVDPYNQFTTIDGAIDQAIRNSDGYAAGASERADARPCTCHPDDNPPKPCAQKYSLNECRADADTAGALTDVRVVECMDSADKAIKHKKFETPGFRDIAWARALILAAPPAPSVADAAGASEDARDAARYRWLRKEHFPTADKPPLAQVVWKKLDDRHESQWANMIDGNDLDRAIDAAIGKEPK